MDLLQPWIGEYVHQVLQEAHQWKIRTLQSSQPAADDTYHDDGSNLRVKSNKKAFVQFAKVSARFARLATFALMLGLDRSNDESRASMDIGL